jgi:hypothetical protein
MAQFQPTQHEGMKDAGRAVAHVAAVFVGLFLMLAGIGMGVTLVMLPVGIGVGFFGLLSFLWGLFGFEK